MKLGVVEQIIEKTSSTGQKFVAICISGEWFTCWKDISGISVGDNVKYDYKERQNGEYRNITKIYKIPYVEKTVQVKEDKQEEEMKDVDLKRILVALNNNILLLNESITTVLKEIKKKK